MAQLTYALYPPASADLPWLAVVLKGDKPIETFGCRERKSAERVLSEMRARSEAKDEIRAAARNANARVRAAHADLD
jgi:hypothetical protein